MSYSGGKTIHQFLSSGTFTVTDAGLTSVEYVIVGGGGGGGTAGSAGGGGVLGNISTIHHILSLLQVVQETMAHIQLLLVLVEVDKEEEMMVGILQFKIQEEYKH